MFDLITETGERPLQERSITSKIVAISLHVGILVGVILVPLFFLAEAPPEVPTIMAFVAPSAAPPPPPPPAPPPAVARKPAPATPTPTAGTMAAPVEAPAEIVAERESASSIESLAGVEGGVEGGVAGGVVGGIVGGIVSPAPVPPPPPPPPVRAAPVRIGGQISAPTLLHRVEPMYPAIAASANLSGLVILEATVDTEGCVTEVKVLRSRHLLLNQAAIDALRQWRYSPLILNGIATPFVLTVTFNFSFAQSRS